MRSRSLRGDPDRRSNPAATGCARFRRSPRPLRSSMKGRPRDDITETVSDRDFFSSLSGVTRSHRLAPVGTLCSAILRRDRRQGRRGGCRRKSDCRHQPTVRSARKLPMALLPDFVGDHAEAASYRFYHTDFVGGSSARSGGRALTPPDPKPRVRAELTACVEGRIGEPRRIDRMAGPARAPSPPSCKLWHSWGLHRHVDCRFCSHHHHRSGRGGTSCPRRRGWIAIWHWRRYG
jgi:hypothetical protein